MKKALSIIAHILAFCAIMFAVLYGISRFGSFRVLDAEGKEQSYYPFSTESVVKERTLKQCGPQCTVVRVK